ncbi:MAG TPA: hypothetical protein VG941_01310 [Candidatus Paceibacterota bacterium]|nr:hypothetical protein [Candidatus Paceibacterota bacterium]
MTYVEWRSRLEAHRLNIKNRLAGATQLPQANLHGAPSDLPDKATDAVEISMSATTRMVLSRIAQKIDELLASKHEENFNLCDNMILDEECGQEIGPQRLRALLDSSQFVEIPTGILTLGICFDCKKAQEAEQQDRRRRRAAPLTLPTWNSI